MLRSKLAQVFGSNIRGGNGNVWLGRRSLCFEQLCGFKQTMMMAPILLFKLIDCASYSSPL